MPIFPKIFMASQNPSAPVLRSFNGEPKSSKPKVLGQWYAVACEGPVRPGLMDHGAPCGTMGPWGKGGEILRRYGANRQVIRD